MTDNPSVKIENDGEQFNSSVEIDGEEITSGLIKYELREDYKNRPILVLSFRLKALDAFLDNVNVDPTFDIEWPEHIQEKLYEQLREKFEDDETEKS